MPLSEHEQRQLEQIEQALRADDPRFANAVHATDPRVHYERRIIEAALGFVIGVGLLLAGVVINVILIGVAGFMVMLACSMWAVTSYRRMTGITTGRVRAKDRGSGRERHTALRLRPILGPADGNCDPNRVRIHPSRRNPVLHLRPQDLPSGLRPVPPHLGQSGQQPRPAARRQRSCSQGPARNDHSQAAAVPGPARNRTILRHPPGRAPALIRPCCPAPARHDPRDLAQLGHRHDGQALPDRLRPLNP